MTTPPFSAKNSQNKTKSNRIFHKKLGADRALILRYADDVVLPTEVFTLADFGLLHGEKCGQSWIKTEKSANFGYVLFP